MSFKEELEKRRAKKAHLADQEARRQNAELAKIETRAAEVAEHLTEEGADVGLVVQNEKGRVTVRHPKSKEYITIDPDTVRYTLFRVVSEITFGRPTGGAGQQSIETQGQIDDYVLNWLESIDVS
jgi:hypothetical protein